MSAIPAPAEIREELARLELHRIEVLRQSLVWAAELSDLLRRQEQALLLALRQCESGPERTHEAQG